MDDKLIHKQRIEEHDPKLILAGGFQPAYVRELVNAFAELGYPVTLLGGDIHRWQDYHPGVRFVNVRGDSSPGRRLHVKIRDLLRFYVKMIRLVCQSPVRLIYKAGIGRPFLDEICLNGLYKLCGKRIIHTVHNVLPHDRETLMNRVLYRIVYRKTTDYLIVHTEHLRERLIKEFAVPSKKITVAPHGTYRVPEVSGDGAGKARRRLGIPGDKWVILTFGYQRPYKGTHILLQALSRENASQVCHLIRGVADPGYAAVLENMIRERGLNEVVDYRWGYVADAEMENLFRAADVVALPYLEGSQSGVLFMAYAYGKPVVASDIGGFRDDIIPGQTGELFAAGNPEALGAVLQKMQGSPKNYRPQFIRRYASQHYSWKSSVEKILGEVYHELQ